MALTRSVHSPAAGPPLCAAVVRAVRSLSPSTKRVVLEAEDSRFRFTAGQWIDLHIPGLSTIGGFTITSTPAQLPLFELAVKASEHPPSRWVTQQCSEGDAVQVRVGGSFCLPSPRPASTIFIAGGVGITPLYAMLQQLLAEEAPAALPAPRAVLLYSAVSMEELLFASELETLAAEFPTRFRLELLTTREAARGDTPSARAGREEIAAAIDWLRCAHAAEGPPAVGGAVASAACEPSDVDVYVCGPRGMPEAIVEEAVACGVPQDSVRYEKWW